MIALRPSTLPLLAFACIAAAACARKPDPADLVLRHGNVITMDRGRPEATAIAMKGGTIVAVGSDDQIAGRVGSSTEVVDLGGRLAIPGFIESHGHCERVAKGEGRLGVLSERMSRDEALRSYTVNAAYAAFDENLKGSLAPGKLADIVVLSKDIMTIPEDEIPSARVDYTIIGGQIVYRAK